MIPDKLVASKLFLLLHPQPSKSEERLEHLYKVGEWGVLLIVCGNSFVCEHHRAILLLFKIEQPLCLQKQTSPSEELLIRIYTY